MPPIKRTLQNLMRPRANEHEADHNLIVIIAIILVFGLVMLSSASAAVAYAKFGSTYYYFKHQLIGLAIGLVAFWFFSKLIIISGRDMRFGFCSAQSLCCAWFSSPD